MERISNDSGVNFLRYATQKNESHTSYTCPFLFRKLKLSREDREVQKRVKSEGFMKLSVWSLHFQYFFWGTELQFGVSSFLQTCFSVKIAVISFDRRKPDKTEEDEPQDPCPYCSNEVPQTKLDCPECKNTIPYCIITVSNTVVLELVVFTYVSMSYVFRKYFEKFEWISGQYLRQPSETSEFVRN